MNGVTTHKTEDLMIEVEVSESAPMWRHSGTDGTFTLGK
jgi:hypothetical protein